MDEELLQRVRDALGARVDGTRTVNIVVPVTDETAQRALDLIECALKSGLSDGRKDILNSDGTNVPK